MAHELISALIYTVEIFLKFQSSCKKALQWKCASQDHHLVQD